jgi:FemAB-related protein (PEP-CTERM system-associated)
MHAVRREVTAAPDSSPVQITGLTPELVGAWDAFVLAHPDGTFFHRSGWAEVLRRAFGHRTHYLIARSGGAVRGVLPLAEIKSMLFGHALVSTPFCVYGGILAADGEAKQALEEHACALARRLGVKYLEMRNRSRQHPDWPVKDLYVTFRKPISPESEQNLNAIPRKQRAMVRKAIQRGLQAEIDTSVDRGYDMYSQSVRNLGTPVFSKKYFNVLQDVFREDCEILTVTTSSGNPVASVLSFYFRDEVLPYYGGGTHEARTVAGNDFMYWAVMDRARGLGKTLFDYGRSKRGTGAFDFKSNWGFEPTPLCYEYFLVTAKEMPNLSPTNSKYERFIRAWKRLPVPVTRMVGPHLAKFLG